MKFSIHLFADVLHNSVEELVGPVQRRLLHHLQLSLLHYLDPSLQQLGSRALPVVLDQLRAPVHVGKDPDEKFGLVGVHGVEG